MIKKIKQVLLPRSLPLQLIGIIAAVLLFGSFIPTFVSRTIYTFSLCFKEVLGFLLPFIIFSFVTTGILSFKKKAPIVLAVMLTLIFISNGFVALLVYGIARLLLPTIDAALDVAQISSKAHLSPLFDFSIPGLFSAEKVLLTSIVIGLFFSFIRVKAVEDLFGLCKRGIELFFAKLFIPLLPLYILGFLLKIQYDGIFVELFQHYGMAIVIIVAVQLVYLGWFYFLAENFSPSATKRAIHRALPSYVTAFSTMSSTATLPVSIPAAERNTGNKALAHIAMPIMANVHLLGDAIGTPILTLVSMMVFLQKVPTFFEYVSFVFYFCIAMFAASGIPGGGIIVMIPILKSLLGFTPEMISVIMTLYLLMDCFGTAANVMGDGALVIIVNKILKKLGIYD
jgi:Na+/H+-dicarboxylate symporter